MSVDEAVEHIHGLGGIAIASHIDRQSYSVIGQLGFIPETLRFDALEISTRTSLGKARELYPEYSGSVFIQNSDAHSLDDIGKGLTRFMLEAPSLDEIKKALRRQEDRTLLQ